MTSRADTEPLDDRARDLLLALHGCVYVEGDSHSCTDRNPLLVHLASGSSFFVSPSDSATHDFDDAFKYGSLSYWLAAVKAVTTGEPTCTGSEANNYRHEAVKYAADNQLLERAMDRAGLTAPNAAPTA